jgi:DNA gyrase subunit B
MYIGSTGPRGLHHLVWEIVDNSIDEALAGYCSEIQVVVHPDNSVSVSDDGRGMPVGRMEKYGKSATEVIMTTLHAGGKFDGQGYKVSGGLHGVGASVVNALSEWLEIEIRREGHVFTQRYQRGFPQGNLTKGRKLKKGEGNGTTIRFLPDPEVFTETQEISFDTLSRRFRESAFLNKGLKISLADEREEDREVTYQYEGGIRDFVAHINEAKDPVHKTVFYLEREDEAGDVEVALQWNSGFQDSVFYLRQQHQHARRRGTPLRFPICTLAHDQRLCSAEGHPQGERGEPHRRRHPRGARGCHLGEALRAAVRGADEDQAWEYRGQGACRE